MQDPEPPRKRGEDRPTGPDGDDRTPTVPPEGGSGELGIIPTPERIGGYPILGVLGTGGMGIVYEAIDPRLERRIAIKVLPPRVQQDPEALARLESEARLLASINHPNIATIYSLEEADGAHFLTMERIDGETLASRISRRRLGVEEVLSIGRQIAAAIEAAHREGVIHRDLKPRNIMISAEGHAKVLDFGVAMPMTSASAGGAASPAAGTAATAGTPGYVSPEQLRGQAADHAADIWAFGCVLYECLASTPAFGGASGWERNAAALQSLPDRGRLPPDTPAALHLILDRCLDPDPASRPAGFRWIRRQIDEEIARRAMPGPIEGAEIRAAHEHNLLLPAAPIVGRGQEIEEVRALLSQCRLLTLTGFGGVGKTRLALEIAWRSIGEHPDGVWMAELSSLPRGGSPAERIARAFGIRESRNRPLRGAVLEHLRELKALLVLDNCERVIQECADLVVEILRSSGGVRILVTSREALAIEGERVYSVPPLAIPDESPSPSAALVRNVDSAALFAARAKAGDGRFEITDANASAVARICRRLDGIPLALELAAARIRILPVEELSRRLDHSLQILIAGSRDAAQRHRTLRAAIDWSHEMLSDSERALLRRLGVFADGWTLEQAESVGAFGPLARWEILEILSRLVEKSLVDTDPQRSLRINLARYRMLSIVREYALERLEQSGERAQADLLHRAACLELAEAAAARLSGPDQQLWLARLDVDAENIRIAIDGCPAEDAAAGLRIAAAMGRYWDLRGRWSEGRSAYERLLAIPGGDDAARASALGWAGVLAGNQGEMTQAAKLLEESLAIHRSRDDPEGVASTLHRLGNLAYVRGEIAKARVLHEESLAIRRALGDSIGTARSLNNLGNIALDQGDFEGARAYYSESLAIKRAEGDAHGIATTLANLGNIAERTGQIDRAAAFHEESLKLLREIGDLPGIARTLYNLGHVAARQGDNARAQREIEESLGIRRGIRDQSGVAICLQNLGFLALQQGQAGLARPYLQESLTIRRSLGDRGGEGAVLNNLGTVALEMGDLAGARRMLEESLAIREEIGDRRGEAICLGNLGVVAQREGDNSRARSLHARSLAVRQEMADWIGVASCLESFSELAEADGDLAGAALLLTVADRLRREANAPRSQTADKEIEATRDAIRDGLGVEEYARIETEGARMGIDEAIRRATPQS